MSRPALISLAVFLALLLTVVATREERVRVGVRSLELPQLEASAVESITLGGPVAARLERRGEAWTVADPAEPERRYSADPAAVGRLVDAIDQLAIAGFVSARPENHVELEIDDEAGLRLQVQARDGQALDVVLGRRAVGGGDLIRRAGEDAVFETRTGLAALARREVDAWRRRRLVDLESNAIERMKIVRPGESPIVLTRGEAEAGSAPLWTLAPGASLPEGFVLDSAAAARAASTLASLQAEAFVDADSGAPVSGLGDRAVRIEAQAAGDTAPLALRLGAVNEDGLVFARVEGDRQTYLVSAARSEQVAPTLEALRDLALLRGDVAEVEKVVYASGDARTELVKRDGAWALVDPPADYDFDPARVPARISVLTRTKGTRVLSEEEAAAADFSDPLRIELTDADGSQRAIVFGTALEGQEDEVPVRASDGFVYAARAVERNRYEDPLPLFERVAAPPPQAGPGGLQGLESLPPDVRRQIEEQLRQQGAR